MHCPKKIPKSTIFFRVSHGLYMEAGNHLKVRTIHLSSIFKVFTFLLDDTWCCPLSWAGSLACINGQKYPPFLGQFLCYYLKPVCSSWVQTYTFIQWAKVSKPMFFFAALEGNVQGCHGENFLPRAMYLCHNNIWAKVMDNTTKQQANRTGGSVIWWQEEK